MSRKKDPSKAKRDILIKKIRRLKKYRIWKNRVLCFYGYNPDHLPKGIQVHHKKEISTILRENNITTLRKAKKCKELWLIEVGVPLKRGEHFIITKISRYKYATKGFKEIMEKWIDSLILLTPTATKRRNNA